MSIQSILRDLPPLSPGHSRTIVISNPGPQDGDYRFGVEKTDGDVVGTFTVEDKDTGDQVFKMSMAAADLIPELEAWLEDLRRFSAGDREKG